MEANDVAADGGIPVKKRMKLKQRKAEEKICIAEPSQAIPKPSEKDGKVEP